MDTFGNLKDQWQFVLVGQVEGCPIGTGIGAELSLTSIGVLNGPEGEPVIELDDKARALLAARGASRLLISLTHTDTLAQAFAVLVR